MKFDGLILEGITGSGKSTVFQRLNCSRVIRSYESTLFLSQAYTLRMAKESDEERYLNAIVDLIDHLYQDYSRSEFSLRNDSRGSLCYVFEGFHYYMALERFTDGHRYRLIRSLEERLFCLGARLVALYLSRNAILENSVISTLKHRGDGWRKFLFQFGSNENEIADYLCRRQDSFLKLAEAPRLPVLMLDSSNQDWDDLVQRTEQFLGRDNH